MPKVQGAIRSLWPTRLVSAPSLSAEMRTMSPCLWVKPRPAARSSTGANMVPQNSSTPSGYGGAAADGGVDQLGDIAADLAIELRRRAEAVLTFDAEADLDLRERVEVEAGIEQADERADRAGAVIVLGLAEQQGAAAFEVPQIDVVAEGRTLDRPLLSTASTTSGSGLFQVETGWMPISAPVPTEDKGGALVKISASGPMPTSRYCDQAPCSISSSFSRIAASEPGFSPRSSPPIISATRPRMASARLGSPLHCSSITRSIMLARRSRRRP